MMDMRDQLFLNANAKNIPIPAIIASNPNDLGVGI
jgi:hypothetical protein